MAGDIYWLDTSLLLHCDGANNSTTFTDKSPLANTVTTNGDAKISTASAPAGCSSSLLLDGTGDYLSIPDNAGFVFSRGDFAIEFRIKTGMANKAIIDRYTASSSTWQVFLTSAGKLQWYTNQSILIGLTTVTTGVWVDVVILRIDGVLKFYVNGALDGSVADNSNYSSSVTSLLVGRQAGTPGYDFLGHLSSIRITKGTSRYTSSPPVNTGLFVGYQKTLALTCNESLTATTFIARGHDVETGVLTGEVTFTGSTCDLPIRKPVTQINVTMHPKSGAWKPSTLYALNDIVFPTNPTTTPYYYKRRAVGISATTEPSWSTAAGGQCNDGAVSNAWEMVERIAQPITQGPLAV